jgi:hypothetical protein
VTCNLPCVAYGFKFGEGCAKQVLCQEDNKLTLEYLPEDPTLDSGKPWMLTKQIETDEEHLEDTISIRYHSVKFNGTVSIEKSSEVIPRADW